MATELEKVVLRFSGRGTRSHLELLNRSLAAERIIVNIHYSHNFSKIDHSIGYVYRHLAAGPPANGLYKHYALLEELGKGSFATVMKAMCKADGRYYAVKIIQANKLRGAATHAVNNGGLSENSPATVFAREISILEQLQHPNICHMKEVFFETVTISTGLLHYAWRLLILFP